MDQDVLLTMFARLVDKQTTTHNPLLFLLIVVGYRFTTILTNYIVSASRVLLNREEFSELTTTIRCGDITAALTMLIFFMLASQHWRIKQRTLIALTSMCLLFIIGCIALAGSQQIGTRFAFGITLLLFPVALAYALINRIKNIRYVIAYALVSMCIFSISELLVFW